MGSKRSFIVTFDETDIERFDAMFAQHYNRIESTGAAHHAACRAVNRAYLTWFAEHDLAYASSCKSQMRDGRIVYGKLRFVFPTVAGAAKAKMLMCGREFLKKF